MKEYDIKSLLQKAEELRALFILGQKVIPFLEEVFSFVGEIKPMLEEINQSIKENLDKMPTLSKQLSKVSEATELATNEILDIVDGIFYKLDIIKNNLKLLENSESPTKRENLVIKEIDELVEKIRNDSTSIMLALQVQDITAQQLAAVNHLLTTVQTRLNVLINKIHTTNVEGFLKENVPTVNVSTLHREIAFDPDAVDSLTDSSARQDEIDKLFSQNSSNIENTEKTHNYNKTLTDDSIPRDEGKISQDEIDKLFTNQ